MRWNASELSARRGRGAAEPCRSEIRDLISVIDHLLVNTAPLSSLLVGIISSSYQSRCRPRRRRSRRNRPRSTAAARTLCVRDAAHAVRTGDVHNHALPVYPPLPPHTHYSYGPQPGVGRRARVRWEARAGVPPPPLMDPASAGHPALGALPHVHDTHVHGGGGVCGGAGMGSGAGGDERPRETSGIPVVDTDDAATQLRDHVRPPPLQLLQHRHEHVAPLEPLPGQSHALFERPRPAQFPHKRGPRALGAPSHIQSCAQQAQVRDTYLPRSARVDPRKQPSQSSYHQNDPAASSAHPDSHSAARALGVAATQRVGRQYGSVVRRTSSTAENKVRKTRSKIGTWVRVPRRGTRVPRAGMRTEWEREREDEKREERGGKTRAGTIDVRLSPRRGGGRTHRPAGCASARVRLRSVPQALTSQPCSSSRSSDLVSVRLRYRTLRSFAALFFVFVSDRTLRFLRTRLSSGSSLFASRLPRLCFLVSVYASVSSVASSRPSTRPGLPASCICSIMLVLSHTRTRIPTLPPCALALPHRQIRSLSNYLARVNRRGVTGNWKGVLSLQVYVSSGLVEWSLTLVNTDTSAGESVSNDVAWGRIVLLQRTFMQGFGNPWKSYKK
ncbi:hypothetical protein FB451DRAFT_1180295 [Mycena latifolia]|nr:hypothetical protein FB451DRAFT_1180295 [Mycena latifolia]